MSGLIQTPCLTLIPLEAVRMYSAVKPSMKVRNGRFIMPLKCMENTSEGTHESLKHAVCPKPLLISEMPYVDEVVKKLSRNHDAFRKTQPDLLYLEEAYERCRIFCAKPYDEKLFNSVFRINTKIEHERIRAIWAIYACARRIDDMVDSTDDENIRSESLDQWEARAKDMISGRPHDMLDAALADTISKFNIDIKLFEDGIMGMRMDITKYHYANFDELFLYCYHVCGSLSLMMFQVVGPEPESTVSYKTIYDGAVYFAIAVQLTNILNDVSDDAQLGRVYLSWPVQGFWESEANKKEGTPTIYSK